MELIKYRLPYNMYYSLSACLWATHDYNENYTNQLRSAKVIVKYALPQFHGPQSM